VVSCLPRPTSHLLTTPPSPSLCTISAPSPSHPTKLPSAYVSLAIVEASASLGPRVHKDSSRVSSQTFFLHIALSHPLRLGLSYAFGFLVRLLLSFIATAGFHLTLPLHILPSFFHYLLRFEQHALTRGIAVPALSSYSVRSRFGYVFHSRAVGPFAAFSFVHV
jgi:hypothetical protein